jgi:hypothetical protein
MAVNKKRKKPTRSKAVAAKRRYYERTVLEPAARLIAAITSPQNGTATTRLTASPHSR